MSFTALKHDGPPQEKVQRLFDEHYQIIAVRCDWMFAGLFIIQWLAGIAAALLISPRVWSGGISQVHPHVWAALVLGATIISLPLFLIVTKPGAPITRHAIGIAQMLYSALLIHLTGGRIETHFHVFGSLAFLAFYRDWRVLITATLVTAVDHFLRGMFWPESVFGVLTASNWRWLEHAGWVIFEDLFLVMSCVQGQREMREIATRQAQMENSNAAIEIEVERRTAELKASQAALKAAKEIAENASSAKSQFLANMSHEIRTPMTAILGYADLLLEPQQDASERLNRVQVIRRNGQHLLTVINDILDISKIEAGRLIVEQIECRPPQLIAEVVSLVSPRASEKNLPLKVECDGLIPSRIQSDPTRLRQILLNLIGNAIKFTKSGSVRIIVGMATKAGDLNPRLRFDIVDTGIGMNDEQVTKLFQPFTQADSSMTRRFGGSGLGLSITKRLVQMLGGDVNIRSSPGNGTTFSVTIQTGSLNGVAMVDTAAGLLAVNDSAPASISAPINPLLGMQIMLAEDGLDNQRLITHILRSNGAEVTVVENGKLAYEAGLKALNEKRAFNVILMDMQMPEMDGYAATSKLRSRGYGGTIIALTAHAMEQDREKCLAAGCDDYAAKPIDRKALINLLIQHRQPAANAA